MVKKRGTFISSVKCLIGLFIAVCCIDATFAQDAIMQADRSVVRIVIFEADKPKGTGTGFVVGAGGIVATNDHVARAGERLLVLSKQADGKLNA